VKSLLSLSFLEGGVINSVLESLKGLVGFSPGPQRQEGYVPTLCCRGKNNVLVERPGEQIPAGMFYPGFCPKSTLLFWENDWNRMLLLPF
jgi:hypothetical protein